MRGLRDVADDYRVRGEELRSIAAMLEHEESSELLRRCAADYERIADDIERRDVQDSRP